MDCSSHFLFSGSVSGQSLKFWRVFYLKRQTENIWVRKLPASVNGKLPCVELGVFLRLSQEASMESRRSDGRPEKKRVRVFDSREVVHEVSIMFVL